MLEVLLGWGNTEWGPNVETKVICPVVDKSSLKHFWEMQIREDHETVNLWIWSTGVLSYGLGLETEEEGRGLIHVRPGRGGAGQGGREAVGRETVGGPE